MLRNSCIAPLFLVAISLTAALAVPDYATPAIYGRSGITGFNLPNGSSTGSSTIALNDLRDVTLDEDAIRAIRVRL